MNKKFDNFHHITQETINRMFEYYAPVFTLTTGRSGSKLLHSIFSQCNDMLSYHEAFPTLQYYSNFAFYNQDNQEILKIIFETNRMEIVLDAYNQNKTYFESNQCLAFYAPAIKAVFKNAKFIHLIRHPGSFIRSAVMKGWHKNDSIWESGRVRIRDNKTWNILTHIEKLAWLWRETNLFISSFMKSINPKHGLTLKLEDIVNDKTIFHNTIVFAGTQKDWSNSQIEMLQSVNVNTIKVAPNEPINIHKRSTYPLFQDWTNNEKKMIKRIAGPLAIQYGYVL